MYTCRMSEACNIIANSIGEKGKAEKGNRDSDGGGDRHDLRDGLSIPRNGILAQKWSKS